MKSPIKMPYGVASLVLTIALGTFVGISLQSANSSPQGNPSPKFDRDRREQLRKQSTQIQRRSPSAWTDPQEVAFWRRSIAIRQKIAREDLDKLDRWWRRENIGDPHKYLLPVILAKLSLDGEYDPQPSWDMLMTLEKERPDLYHFRSLFDIRIFFQNRDRMPAEVTESYRSMLQRPRVKEWNEGGTENHKFMQRASGLALSDGSGFPDTYPSTAATNEAWLRSELDKFLTIGQGEFHSSIYYGYSIGALLNLYDFARTPELRKLATAILDWYATNMALRWSWGTAGGAESRGFDRATWDSGLAAVAWIWWGFPPGSEADPTEIAENMKSSYARLALAPALSSYRPPAHLHALAHKEVPLPFLAHASHPVYYSYHKENHLWETFYVTEDYSLSTLLEPSRSYQVQGTIRAQYATYKLVIRDRQGLDNPVVSLGGTYHTPMATGRSPADQYVQGRSAVLYQQILNPQDIQAGVPPRSHLVLPQRYGEPRRHGEWYIWQIENVWLLARPWGERVSLQMPVSEKHSDYQALVARGEKTAWITDVARLADYPDWQRLTQALDRTSVTDEAWAEEFELAYRGLDGDRLTMTYQPDGAIAEATINGEPLNLDDWPILDSPYVSQKVNSGVLQVNHPHLGTWRLRATVSGPEWEANP